jgi:glucosamine-6-phosphate deaminase
MLLVQLDQNTIKNAVADGHFPSIEESPRYAVSMGAELVFRARSVLLVANGSRKTAPVAESLLGKPSCAVPISYGRTAARGGTRIIYVLDREAAAGILPEAGALRRQGIEVEDISSQATSVKVEDLKFFSDPASHRLT